MPYPVIASRRTISPLGQSVPSGAVASFSPLDLSPVLWIDFSDISTLYQDSLKATPVTSDGDVIGAAEDKSGNGNDATQGTSPNKPVYKANIKNSLSCALGDTTDVLTLNSGISVTDMTLVWVGYRTSEVAEYLLGNSANAVHGLGHAIAGAGDLVFRTAAGLTSTVANGTYGLNAWHLGGFKRESNALTARLNSSDVTLGTPTNSGAWTIPGIFGRDSVTRGYVGYWAEMFIFDTALSADNIASMETWVNNKWSVY
jgi:hypothetical protein